MSNKILVLIGLLSGLTSCNREDSVFEKQRTRYVHEQETIFLSRIPKRTDCKIFGQKKSLLLDKINARREGKTSIHVTLLTPDNCENDREGITMIKEFLISSGIPVERIHTKKWIKSADVTNPLLIKLDYYQAIPPICDDTYGGYGHYRCSYENNLVLMIEDPIVFFNTGTHIETRAKESIAAIEKYDAGEGGSKDEKSAKPDLAAALSGLLGGIAGK